MEHKEFYCWKELNNYAKNTFNISNNLQNACGIGRIKGTNICILRSVEGTEYYKDDLKNMNKCYYTLFGKIGDQDLNEKRFNQFVMEQAEEFYLYEVRKNKTYIWFGKYKMLRKKLEILTHPDENGNPRKIYRIVLKRITPTS